MLRRTGPSAVRHPVQEVQEGHVRRRTDLLVVEEPLEIRLWPDGAAAPVSVAVTMRTPGADFELAAGFLFTEGILSGREAIRAIRYCTDAEAAAGGYNTVNVYLRPGVAVDLNGLRRHFYTTSSCGICGKASVDAVRVRCAGPVGAEDLILESSAIARMGEALRAAQPLFDRTGGLHAAGLFDAGGNLLAAREDVGRHNAVDKLIGHALLEGMLPLSRCALMVSGRASFEIVQKAAVAGIPVVVAVSAPSSLACAAAQEFGMTLIGFARGLRFNVYTGTGRVRV